MNIYIYGLVDSNSGKVRYVGVTNDLQRRYKEHLYDRRFITYKTKWIDKLLRSGFLPKIITLEMVSIENWKKREAWWINYFKKKKQLLTNLTNGGEGTFGIKCSEEKKKKISNSLMGHIVNKETRNKLSKSHKGYNFYYIK